MKAAILYLLLPVGAVVGGAIASPPLTSSNSGILVRRLADVPVYEYPNSGPHPNCHPAVFNGSGPDKRGQLDVQTGPGTDYRTIHRLDPGDAVMVFEFNGDWAGVAFGHHKEKCGATYRRPVATYKQGWIRWNKVTFLPG